MSVLKNKTKEPSLTYHSRCKQSNEAIRIWINYMEQMPRAGKCAYASHDWIWFCFSLAENVEPGFLTNRRAKYTCTPHVKPMQMQVTFDIQMKTSLIVETRPQLPATSNPLQSSPNLPSSMFFSLLLIYPLWCWLLWKIFQSTLGEKRHNYLL